METNAPGRLLSLLESVLLISETSVMKKNYSAVHSLFTWILKMWLFAPHRNKGKRLVSTCSVWLKGTVWFRGATERKCAIKVQFCRSLPLPQFSLHQFFVNWGFQAFQDISPGIHTREERLLLHHIFLPFSLWKPPTVSSGTTERKNPFSA